MKSSEEVELLDPTLLNEIKKKKQKFKSELEQIKIEITIIQEAYHDYQEERKKLGSPISPLQYFHEKKMFSLKETTFETQNVEEIEKKFKIWENSFPKQKMKTKKIEKFETLDDKFFEIEKLYKQWNLNKIDLKKKYVKFLKEKIDKSPSIEEEFNKWEKRNEKLIFIDTCSFYKEGSPKILKFMRENTFKIIIPMYVLTS
jgi:hypothetical protein